MSTTGEVQTDGGGRPVGVAVPATDPKAGAAAPAAAPAKPKGRKRLIGLVVLLAAAPGW